MNGTFYDLLGGMAGVFEQWSACEKTVVACALAKRVPWPGLKLLQRAVDAALQNHQDDERMEREANDELYLAGLIARIDDEDVEGDTLRQLLTLLPLLRTDNERAKEVYVCNAPSLVQRCMESTRPAWPDLCRQLLTYLLVHPAVTAHDHRTLTQWLRYLENHISGSNTTDALWQQRNEPGLAPSSNIWGPNAPFRRTIGKNVEFRGVDVLDSYNADLQESFSKNGRDVDLSSEGESLNFDATIAQPKCQRSNSLTPPSTNFFQMSSSSENLSDEAFVQKPRSFSLSSEHSLSQIRPISIMYGTTGSETRLDDLRCNNFVEYPGMSMVAHWLKSLRLHKYVWLFTNISYEQMMAMDDEYLEKLGVTKGARHKLLLSIKKLQDRPSQLAKLQSELSSGEGGNLGGVLQRVRGVLATPLPPGELPQAVVRVLELASKQLPPAPSRPVERRDDEDAVDPMSLHCWLVEKALHHPSFSSPELVEALRRMRHRLPPRQFFLHVGDLPRKTHHGRWRGISKPRRPPTRPKSHSYPPFPAPIPFPAPTPDYSSLDALCLQMTEQAIN